MSITYKDALVLASERVSDLETPDTGKLVIALEQTHTRAEGWVFFYVTEDYRRTGEFKYTLLGNAPVFVTTQRQVHMLGPTALSWEENLADLLNVLP